MVHVRDTKSEFSCDGAQPRGRAVKQSVSLKMVHGMVGGSGLKKSGFGRVKVNFCDQSRVSSSKTWSLKQVQIV
jgi:hypothetical protein